MTDRKFYRQGPAVTDVEERTTTGGSHIPRGWLKMATDRVRLFVDAGRAFTAADLRRAGLPEPVHQNHWGSLFSHLQSHNIIKPVGLRIEQTYSSGTKPVRVWAGVDETTE